MDKNAGCYSNVHTEIEIDVRKTSASLMCDVATTTKNQNPHYVLAGNLMFDLVISNYRLGYEFDNRKIFIC